MSKIYSWFNASNIYLTTLPPDHVSLLQYNAFLLYSFSNTYASVVTGCKNFSWVSVTFCQRFHASLRSTISNNLSWILKYYKQINYTYFVLNLRNKYNIYDDKTTKIIQKSFFKLPLVCE